MLLLSIGLVTAHAQAPPPPDRMVPKPEHALVATPSFPLTAQAASVASEAPITAAPVPTAAQLPTPAPGAGKRYPVSEVVAPPSSGDSVVRASTVPKAMEPRRPARPDPGRPRKGYNYR